MLRRLFDGESLIPFEDTPSPARVLSQVGVRHREAVAGLVQKLCLYDQVVIPTVDTALIPMLPALIGPDRLLRYLDEGVIRFVRYRGFTAFVGGGAGLDVVEIRSPNNPPPGAPARSRIKRTKAQRAEDLIGDAASSDVDRALDTMMAHFHMAEIMGEAWAAEYTRRVLAATEEVPSGVGFFKAAYDETYRDIQHDRTLSTLFAVNGTRNLKVYPGVSGQNIRWLQTRHWNDPVDVMLHMAQFNLEVALAKRADCQDQTAGPSAHASLTRKARRVMNATDAEAAFETVTSTSGLPDFLELSENDQLHDAVLNARDSHDGAAFRQWVHSHLRDEPHELATAFHELAASRGLGDLGAVRALRFVVSTGAQGLATILGGGVAGFAVAAADTFLVDNFLRRDPQPKIFVREVKAAFGSYSDLAN